MTTQTIHVFVTTLWPLTRAYCNNEYVLRYGNCRVSAPRDTGHRRGHRGSGGRNQPTRRRPNDCARMAEPGLIRAGQGQARHVTQWTRRQDEQLHRLMCYIDTARPWRIVGCVGNDKVLNSPKNHPRRGILNEEIYSDHLYIIACCFGARDLARARDNNNPHDPAFPYRLPAAAARPYVCLPSSAQPHRPVRRRWAHARRPRRRAGCAAVALECPFQPILLHVTPGRSLLGCRMPILPERAHHRFLGADPVPARMPPCLLSACRHLPRCRLQCPPPACVPEGESRRNKSEIGASAVAEPAMH